MSIIHKLLLPDGTSIYVESEEVDLPKSSNGTTSIDLPYGAEHVGAVDNMLNAMDILKNTIASTANTVHKSLQEAKPDEWSVELSIGFKGKTTPIPVILSGESDVAIKVLVKWKKIEEVE